MTDANHEVKYFLRSREIVINIWIILFIKFDQRYIYCIYCDGEGLIYTAIKERQRIPGKLDEYA
jgi:hypothetical protein